MSKIANAFKDGKAFIAFLTGGDPAPEKTVEYILTMEKAGADLIEIGIPFSDPTAEGVVIQDANIRALKAGTTTDKIFEIVPDLPYEEKHEVTDVADQYGVDIISMIAPTSKQRIQMIASEAKGFIYIVSSMGVTGVRSEITTDIPGIVEAIRQVSDVPAAVGFGISTPAQAEEMAKASDGAIVGSAIVKIIAAKKDQAAPDLYDYVRSMKEAVQKAD